MRIIYFDIDCLRPDHLGCYGYPRPTSPAIDALAREGTCFDRCYCSSSPCLPSRTAWSSGRFGIRNGVLSNHSAGARFHITTHGYGGPLPGNEMLMRHLRRNGYDTVSFSNFADRHNAMWFMWGWSEFHTPNLKGGRETAAEVNAPVLRWLEHNAKRENYLLHINYWDAHRAYRMNASWAERFRGFPVPQAWPDEDTIRSHQGMTGYFTAQNQCFEDNKSPFPLMPDAVSNRRDFEHMVTGYDAAIAYEDHYVKQVLDELGRQGVLDDAVVIVSADHGDAFGEHGIYSDHVNADECIHHIPLIIRWPGVTPGGTRSDRFVYNLDLGPTLCEALGIAPPEQWDGASFLPSLRGDSQPNRPFLVWDCGLYAVQRAVRTPKHLMIRTFDDFGYGFAPIELYDMTSDPYQTRNIAESCPDVVAACSRMLEDWTAAQMRKPDWSGDPLSDILAERARKPGDIHLRMGGQA